MKRLSSSNAVVAASAASAVISCPSRDISQTAPAGTPEGKEGWRRFWGGSGDRIRYPRTHITAPKGSGIPKLRKTHIEWKFYHGLGGRIGRYDAGRYISDFEFADGTPAPATRARHALLSFHDRQLFEMIQSAALVEGLAETNRLPRIPGVREQREWDPSIPLFLDDMDDHGAPPSLQSVADGLSKGADAAQRRADAHFRDQQAAMDGKTIIKNTASEGESLTPITMFASYSPAAMFTEKQNRGYKGVAGASKPSPFDRRRWNMTDNFLVYKGPKARNTIGDGQVKSA